MKINYIAQYNGKPEMGVTKKLISQIEQINKNEGVEAKLIFLSRRKDNRIKSKYVQFYSFPGPPYTSFLDKLRSYLFLVKYITRLMKQFEDDEIIYFRNYFPTWGFLRALKKNKRKNIFIDIVSNNVEEAKIRKSNLAYRYSLAIFGSQIANSSKGIISVTREIIQLNFPKLKKTIPTLVIGNGFDTETVPVCPNKSFDNSNTINFICVAHVSVWHGLDRFIYGMANYCNNYNKMIHLHLVGEGPNLGEIKKLVLKLDIKDKVTFHGFKSGEELDNLFNISHIGVGNLGTFRKGIKYTSPLKSREYCSRGIPFFYTCTDEDFINFPFAYNVPPNDTPINIEEILMFYNRVSTVKNFNYKMREYALINLTWNAKMMKLIDFMKSNV